MNFFEDFVCSTFASIVAPIILFLLAFFVFKNNWILKTVAKTYQAVINGLHLNLDEPVAAPSVREEISDEKDNKLTYYPNISGENNVIQRISANYGPDGHWKVRTFYVINKDTILDNNFINFKIRGFAGLNIGLACRDLIKIFSLNDEESISDGKGRIRIYIYQEDVNDASFYLTRFGKHILDKPILLTPEK